MRDVLVNYVRDALTELGGRATLVQIAKHIWQHHRGDLERMGDLFYTWQYDMRWAATKLRRDGKLKAATRSPKGTWELT